MSRRKDGPGISRGRAGGLQWRFVSRGARVCDSGPVQDGLQTPDVSVPWSHLNYLTRPLVPKPLPSTPLSVSRSLSLSLPLYPSLSLSLSRCVCLSLSLSVSLFLSFSLLLSPPKTSGVSVIGIEVLFELSEIYWGSNSRSVKSPILRLKSRSSVFIVDPILGSNPFSLAPCPVHSYQ